MSDTPSTGIPATEKVYSFAGNESNERSEGSTSCPSYLSTTISLLTGLMLTFTPVGKLGDGALSKK